MQSSGESIGDSRLEAARVSTRREEARWASVSPSAGRDLMDGHEAVELVDTLPKVLLVRPALHDDVDCAREDVRPEQCATEHQQEPERPLGDKQMAIAILFAFGHSELKAGTVGCVRAVHRVALEAGHKAKAPLERSKVEMRRRHALESGRRVIAIAVRGEPCDAEAARVLGGIPASMALERMLSLEEG